jgi:hypothetical protein
MVAALLRRLFGRPEDLHSRRCGVGQPGGEFIDFKQLSMQAIAATNFMYLVKLHWLLTAC